MSSTVAVVQDWVFHGYFALNDVLQGYSPLALIAATTLITFVIVRLHTIQQSDKGRVFRRNVFAFIGCHIWGAPLERHVQFQSIGETITAGSPLEDHILFGVGVYIVQKREEPKLGPQITTAIAFPFRPRVSETRCKAVARRWIDDVLRWVVRARGNLWLNEEVPRLSCLHLERPCDIPAVMDELGVANCPSVHRFMLPHHFLQNSVCANPKGEGKNGRRRMMKRALGGAVFVSAPCLPSLHYLQVVVGPG